jgi:hypothetical protein
VGINFHGRTDRQMVKLFTMVSEKELNTQSRETIESDTPAVSRLRCKLYAEVCITCLPTNLRACVTILDNSSLNWMLNYLSIPTSLGYRQFYKFLQVDWAKYLTYSRNMYILTYLKARELSW